MLNLDNDIIQQSTLFSASLEVRKLGTQSYSCLDKSVTQRAFEMHEQSVRKSKSKFPWVTILIILFLVPFVLATSGANVKGKIAEILGVVQSSEFERVVGTVQSQDVHVAAWNGVLANGMTKK